MEFMDSEIQKFSKNYEGRLLQYVNAEAILSSVMLVIKANLLEHNKKLTQSDRRRQWIFKF